MLRPSNSCDKPGLISVSNREQPPITASPGSRCARRDGAAGRRHRLPPYVAAANVANRSRPSVTKMSARRRGAALRRDPLSCSRTMSIRNSAQTRLGVANQRPSTNTAALIDALAQVQAPVAPTLYSIDCVFGQHERERQLIHPRENYFGIPCFTSQPNKGVHRAGLITPKRDDVPAGWDVVAIVGDGIELSGWSEDVSAK